MKTCEHSAPMLFEETELPSTSSPAGSHVRTLASLESGLASRVRDLVYGRNIGDLLASYDHDSSSLRTCQASLVSGAETYSETLPRSGMMLAGNVYQRVPLALPTDVTGSGLLPTPEASNTKAVALRSGGRKPRNFLAPLRSTPTASEHTGPGHKAQGGMNLRTAVMVATPTSRDWRSGKASPETLAKNSRPLSEQVGGSLNPTWVEWLMGYPLGWTVLEHWATRSSRKLQKSSAEP